MNNGGATQRGGPTFTQYDRQSSAESIADEWHILVCVFPFGS